MIIDFHTHTFPHRLSQRVVDNFSKIRPIPLPTPEELSLHLEQAGIERHVLLPVAFRPDTVRDVNEFSLGLQGPDTLSLAAIHPDSPDVLEQLEELKHQGVKGVKLHPELQQFSIENSKYRPIYHKIGDLSLITVIHSGQSYSRRIPQCTPKNFLLVADEFRGAPVVLAHMGGSRISEEERAIALGLPVYLDTSLSPRFIQPEDFLRQVDTIGVDHILFGSDFPYSLPEDMLRYIQALPLTESERQSILCDNAKKLLRWEM